MAIAGKGILPRPLAGDLLERSDTMLLAWWITGNPFTGLKIGAVELITKMILYYFHERAWYKVDFGLKKRKHKKKEMAKQNSLNYTNE